MTLENHNMLVNLSYIFRCLLLLGIVDDIMITKGFAKEVAEAAQVKLDRPTCLYLMVNHAPNNSATYQPGTDAEGNAVIGADLNSIKIEPPSEIQVPVRIDLSRYLRLGDIHTPMAKVGEIKRMENGQLYFNNQPLFQEDQTQVIEACKKILAYPPS
jgi:hypothetical protein